MHRLARPSTLAVALGLAVAAAAAPARAAFDIVLNPGTDLAANPAALAAFNRAAGRWEARFTDDITVNLDANVTASGFANPNTIGGASPVFLTTSFDTGRFALTDDRDANEAILDSLPTAATFTATTPSGRTVAPAADLQLIGTRANFKALNFGGLDDGAADATITFNSAFSFDFDNRDGVSPGQIDFESVAVHEIGHSLGFFSIVDLLAGNPNFTSVSPTFLDLFRFADTGTNPSTAAEFSTFARKLDPGAAHFDDAQREVEFSSITDGNQASHWKADEQQGGVYLGIMDPTFAAGVGPYPITSNDLRAFGLIGYDVNAAFVPEPTTLGVLGGIAIVALRRRRPAIV